MTFYTIATAIKKALVDHGIAPDDVDAIMARVLRNLEGSQGPVEAIVRRVLRRDGWLTTAVDKAAAAITAAVLGLDGV